MDGRTWILQFVLLMQRTHEVRQIDSPFRCLQCLGPHLQVQVTVVSVHSMKACRVNGGIVPLILNVDITRKRVVNFTARALYFRWKNLRCALQDRRYGLQNHSGNFGEGKMS
jgi:hypothetical protein